MMGGKARIERGEPMKPEEWSQMPPQYGARRSTFTKASASAKAMADKPADKSRRFSPVQKLKVTEAA
jgi:hypothetical protein